MNTQDKFELVQANAEDVYYKGKVQELHDHIADLIPHMTNVEIGAIMAMFDVELKERDPLYTGDVALYVDDLPF